MSFDARHFVPALGVGFFFAGALMTSACDTSSTCSVDEDCFAGEVCVDAECRPDSEMSGTNNGNGSNNGANNGANNGGPNNGTGSNNGVNNGATTNNGVSNNGSNNGTGSNNGGTSNNNGGGARACEIDLFGNTCDDDAFEPNDGYNPAGGDQYALPWEGNSWCGADGMLVEPSRNIRGRFCAGDGGDAFRFYVSNSGPVCITGDIVTIKIVVEIETDCAREDVHIEPYTFGRDPIRNELCVDDDDVRCMWTGNTLEILWLWPVEQSFDPRLHIASPRDDVQFDYNVTFEIIQ